jgi:anhydro-N-acetylmuramic acid kinase
MQTIGIMSGTSLDGMDAALVDFDAHDRPTLSAHCYQPYPLALVERLRAMDAQAPLAEVLSLDAALAGHYAQLVAQLLTEADCPASRITAIGLHGQTIWHHPQGDPAVTCQIGDPARLAEQTGIRVVAQFRQRDMAAGGEGAPLAPVFHAALFATETPRAVINLGGIANITLLDGEGQIVAGFDCGPANTLLDAWARQALGRRFDEHGQWAASGTVDQRLLAQWLSDPYFAAAPPKSTGPEVFNLRWAQAAMTGHEAPADVQATLAELTARSIAMALDGCTPAPTDVVICGGGVHNADLMARIRTASRCPVHTAEALGYPSAAIEAMGFAWLARAAVRGDALDLREVTGARHPVRLGAIYPA